MCEAIDAVTHPANGGGGDAGPCWGEEGEQEGEDDFEKAGDEGGEDGEEHQQAGRDGVGVDLIEVNADEGGGDEPGDDAGGKHLAWLGAELLKQALGAREPHAGPQELFIGGFMAGEEHFNAAGAENQPGHGDEGKLEAGHVEVERMKGEHEKGSEAKELKGTGAAAQEEAQEEDDAHEGSAADGDGRGGGEGIEEDNADADAGGGAGMEKEAAAEEVDAGGEDGDVKAADGQEMGGAGAGKIVLHILHLRGVIAEDQCAEEGVIEGLGLGEAEVEKVAGAVAQGVQQAGGDGLQDMNVFGVGDVEGGEGALVAVEGGEVKFAGIHGGAGALEHAQDLNALASGEGGEDLGDVECQAAGGIAPAGRGLEAQDGGAGDLAGRHWMARGGGRGDGARGFVET